MTLDFGDFQAPVCDFGAWSQTLTTRNYLGCDGHISIVRFVQFRLEDTLLLETRGFGSLNTFIMVLKGRRCLLDMGR